MEAREEKEKKALDVHLSNRIAHFDFLEEKRGKESIFVDLEETRYHFDFLQEKQQ